MEPKTKWIIDHSQLKGQGLTAVMQSITELPALEFRNRLNVHYSKVPSDLPTKCDGCGSPFTTQHAPGYYKVVGSSRVIYCNANVTYGLKTGG